MNKHLEYMEPVTPIATLRNLSFWRSEDSGYNTSFTPGSFDYTETSNENLEPGSTASVTNGFQLTKNSSVNGRCHKYRRFKSTPIASHHAYASFPGSPVQRRGIKRPFQQDNEPIENSFGSIPTPTSVIAGGIQKLKVNDGNSSPVCAERQDGVLSLHSFYNLSYPTTPIKKMCRSVGRVASPAAACNITITSPLQRIDNISYLPKRSAKKLNFALNSLPGETEAITKPRQSKVVRNIFTPEKKVDVINALFKKVCCMPAIINIFSFLSNEDIYNFSLVSPTWLQVCEKVNEANLKKKEYVQFINNTKENHANRKSGNLEKPSHLLDRNQKEPGSSLKDINNIVNSRSVKSSPKRSPPVTPRTRRFKKFIKSASLDSRMQLSCVRCRQPAKVNEECTGEEWADCTSILCSYQFCRFCQSDRHPGKICYHYDLSRPSPSKRKISSDAIGTKKSKKNLRRLL